ncbi:auxin-responsive protein SAUR71-like [Silene latifolia]|uniref:auxin-responsive protein SAUR71-like n=1 Tax=Silene latifolia TaxID=37657 RepID=UPI003D771585
MKDLIGKLVKKKDQYSSSLSPPRYSKLNHYDDNTNGFKQEIRRGFVPIMVGKFEEEEERFMVPTKLLTHSSILNLLQLDVNEFGYQQDGVLHIHCEPYFFRETLDHISLKRK